MWQIDLNNVKGIQLWSQHHEETSSLTCFVTLSLPFSLFLPFLYLLFFSLLTFLFLLCGMYQAPQASDKMINKDGEPYFFLLIFPPWIGLPVLFQSSHDYFSYCHMLLLCFFQLASPLTFFLSLIPVLYLSLSEECCFLIINNNHLAVCWWQ